MWVRKHATILAMKVRTTMLLKYYFSNKKNENEKESSFSIHRGKCNDIFINNDRLSYKTIWWWLNARDTPHFKLYIIDAGSLKLREQVQGLDSRLVFHMGKTRDRNKSTSRIRCQSIAFLKATCTIQNIIIFGILINEAFKQELETISATQTKH